jgi:hypothetical protein
LEPIAPKRSALLPRSGLGARIEEHYGRFRELLGHWFTYRPAWTRQCKLTLSA